MLGTGVNNNRRKNIDDTCKYMYILKASRSEQKKGTLTYMYRILTNSVCYRRLRSPVSLSDTCTQNTVESTGSRLPEKIVPSPEFYKCPKVSYKEIVLSKST